MRFSDKDKRWSSWRREFIILHGIKADKYHVMMRHAQEDAPATTTVRRLFEDIPRKSFVRLIIRGRDGASVCPSYWKEIGYGRPDLHITLQFIHEGKLETHNLKVYIPSR